MAIPFSTCPSLARLPGITHGFFGRQGGVSTGLYDSLNVGVGSDDKPDAIERNRTLVSATLGAKHLLSCYQVHSARVIPVDAPWTDRPEADAMVTNRPGIGLCILTADCTPVLFADAEAGIIGAAHAGWKGALGGVTDNVIAAMEKLGSDRANIACAIGPCIAQASYEVDAAFRARFLDTDANNDRFFATGKADHFQFDIEDYVAARLQAAGISIIDKLGLDTYANEDRYFSYRRSCHHDEPGYGRQISLIGLAD